MPAQRSRFCRKTKLDLLGSLFSVRDYDQANKKNSTGNESAYPLMSMSLGRPEVIFHPHIWCSAKK